MTALVWVLAFWVAIAMTICKVAKVRKTGARIAVFAAVFVATIAAALGLWAYLVSGTQM